MKKLVIYVLVPFLAISCNPMKTNNYPDSSELSLSWEFLENHPAEGYFSSEFTLENKSEFTLENKGWALYYNQMGKGVIQQSVTGNVQIEHINGNLFKVTPTSEFSLSPGEILQISFKKRGRLLKENEAPLGPYMVFSDEKEAMLATVDIDQYSIKPFPALEKVFPSEYEIPLPDASWIYELNKPQKLLNREVVGRIIPTPKQVTLSDQELRLGEGLMIHHDKGLQREAEYLAEMLGKVMSRIPAVMQSQTGGPTIIRLKAGKEVIPLKAERYQLSARADQGVSIVGGGPAGVFYGIQSLLASLPVEAWAVPQSELSLKQMEITDKPAFAYRGMHLDIARNFIELKAIKKLIQIMAFYKMNTLHLHVTDDEAWRLEIPSLPELTEIGGFRGHTTHSKDQLLPQYGSGPAPDPESSHGSGFLTRDDFIDLLRFASDHHITVIPEINFPGHARSAIYAMEARYDRLMDEGKEEDALEYRLIDPADASKYNSAQDFNDNVVCVCMEAPYRFYETVLDELIRMYEEAGLEMATMHVGGDEVPHGAWTGSPLCEAFLAKNPEWGGADNLQAYFEGRLFEILKKRNLVMAGWEEVAMKKNEEGVWIPNPDLVGDQVLPYVWNSLDNNLDLGNRLANAGFPVILCNATNFYFDFGYNHHPREPGHYWGGLVNTRRAFEFIPFDVFKSTLYDRYWEPIQSEAYAGMEGLKPEAYTNIVGLQGELWSEFIKGGEMLEYFYMPKMLGLVERAWAGQAGWGSIENRYQRIASMNTAWNAFANTIGQREMPRLDYLFGGFNYRLPPPGAILRNGQLFANSDFPGLTIRYSTDGSEPGIDSPEYTGPIRVSGEVRLRSFDTRGKGSSTSVVR